ncbi:MAG: hypothetical protein RLW87_14590 [Alphaproteobacteria bacterium]
MTRYILLLILPLLTAACVPDGHRPYGVQADLPPDLDRSTEVDLSDAYFAALPDCVTILPMGAGTDGGAPILEAAMTRHARDRFSRVIGGPERRALTDHLLVDLTVPEDRAYFARRTRCRHFLTFAPWGGEDLYAVVYSRKTVGIAAQLTDGGDGAPLWRARHVAVRSDGSLPLSPLGVVIGAFEAARLEGDADLPNSMADDVARRLISTLPDLGLRTGSTVLTKGGVLDSGPLTMGD